MGIHWLWQGTEVPRLLAADKMASLSDPVAPVTAGVGIGCSGMKVGWGGGKPGGALRCLDTLDLIDMGY